MESTPGLIAPILRVQQITSYQGSAQGQKSPFYQGQLLQGVVGEKSADNTFVLKIDNNHVLTESSVQLKPGQVLNLQVQRVEPKIVLQLVNDPITQHIGKSLPLLGQQSTLIANAVSLAATNAQPAPLSPTTEQTFSFFSSIATMTTPPTLIPATAPAEAAQISQLLKSLVQIGQQTAHDNTPVNQATLVDKIVTLGSQHIEFANIVTELLASSPQNQLLTHLLSPVSGTLQSSLDSIFQVLTRSPSTPQEKQQATEALALAFKGTKQQLTGQISSTGNFLPSQSSAPKGELSEISNLLNTISKLQPGNQSIQNLTSQLLGLIKNDQLVLPSPLLYQLLNSVIPKPQESHSYAMQQTMSGEMLAQASKRLGINLEQQLATAAKEEATQTLKFALIELAQKNISSESLQHQAHQLIKTVELMQMVQLKLSGEAFLFLPLPFSFLDQGFLLVSDEQARDGEQSKNKETQKKYGLHLQLEGLGNMQIDLKEHNGRVSLLFKTEDNEKAQFIGSFREELENTLTALKLQSVQFLSGAEEPNKTLLTKMVQGTTGMVNTKA